MDDYFDLNPQTYDWCARAFDRVRNLLGLRIKMHHATRQVDDGAIFLFNHFARMETFIPQYLIYQETGEYCRSIAAAEFFKGNDRFARLLRDLGVVPNDHPRLMELLATDLLRGRKVVVFPEGGMVKDRQALDERGELSIYSRHARARRKHHTGAARLATGLQIFKYAVCDRAARGDQEALARWAEDLGVAGTEALLAAARRAVVIVPANITFYPLRVSDNVLRRATEMLAGKLSQRAVEELVVEGNLLLKATDMDINLGASMAVPEALHWLERPLLGRLARELPDLGAVFDIDWLERRLLRRVATYAANRAIERIRDRYMASIYQSAVVNLSHLASTIIQALVERGDQQISQQVFRQALYLAIKRVQAHPEIRLHRGLCDPERYQAVLEQVPSALTEFLDSASASGLIEHDAGHLRFRAKLRQEHDFDQVRLENPIEVYANEVAPLAAVGRAVGAALAGCESLDRRRLAEEWFDDERKAHAWDRALYQQRKHYEINSRETATADASPFLFVPAQPRAVGIVLVHGFLASPAEVRAFGEKLHAQGHAVVGVRLKGHGTSPWDLRERGWRDWLHSVERGRAIMAGITERVALVGFSTGGSLCLINAAEDPRGVAGAAAVCAPIKFRNTNMRFVPLMHGAAKVVRWLSSYEGPMPFRANDSEHPHINYRHMPLRGLYELTRVVAHLQGVLPDIEVPVCLLQSTGDRVVDPDSAGIAYEKIPALRKELHWIEAERHGILNEDVGETHALLLDFVARLDHDVDAGVINVDAGHGNPTHA